MHSGEVASVNNVSIVTAFSRSDVCGI